MEEQILAGLMRTRLGSKIRLKDISGREIYGECCFIFPANVARRQEDIIQYYGIDEEHRSYRGVSRTHLCDTLVFRHSSETYYIVNRFHASTRWLTAYELLEAE